MSRRTACRLTLLTPATYYYRAHGKDDTPISARLRELAQFRQGWGYLRLHVCYAANAGR